MKSQIKSNQAVSDEVDVALDDVVSNDLSAAMSPTADIGVDEGLFNGVHFKVEAEIFYAVDLVVRWKVLMLPPEPDHPNLDKFLKVAE